MTVYFDPKDKQVNEDYLDDLVSFLKQFDNTNINGKVYVLNRERAKMLDTALKIIKGYFEDTCSVTYKRRESVPTTVDVKIRGKIIYIENPQRFTRDVLRNANNFEVVTYNDQMMELNISFSNIMSEVG